MMRRAYVASAITMAAVWGCGIAITGSAGDGASNGDAASASSPDGGGGDNGGGDAFASDAPFSDAPPPPTIHAQSALGFTATSKQYVDYPNIPIPTDFTVEAWVRPFSRGNEMIIVSEDRDTNTNDQFRLAVTDVGTLYFAMSDTNSNDFGLLSSGATTGIALMTGTPLPLGTWSHVAIAKNGNAFSLLVNALVVSSFATTSPTFVRGTGFNFRVGARMGIGGPTGYFDGTIDEVRLFAVARSPAEIEAAMRTELAVTSPGFASLLSYWRFDENIGLVAKDDKNKFEGTLINTPKWVVSDAF